MGFGWKVLTVGAAGVLVVVIGAVGLFAWSSRAQESHFCQASLAIVEIDGRSVAPQDQTGPTEDPWCDFDQTEDAYPVLGFDCRIRQPDGEVIAKLVPNRHDGTCGLPDPGEDLPDPWPKA
ncbi:MAG: hypothetical protein JWO77_511 [Ilumatobacteraceae bacterium]|nr:hypothetical protein [Ilumatobacteraceae bacterium]